MSIYQGNIKVAGGGGDVSNKADKDLGNITQSAQIPLANSLNDIFKTQTYTVVGSPTIANGVVSGFSATSGIKVENFHALTSDWEIIVKAANTPNASQQRLIIADGMYLRDVNSEWGLWFANGAEIFSSQQKQIVDYPYAKITKTNNKADFSVSIDGKSWEIVGSDLSVGDGLTDTGYLLFGQDSLYWNGTLDLKATSIKVDGSYWFIGQATNASPAHLASPSNVYEDFTIPNYDDTITAPADGYFTFFSVTNGGENQNVSLINMSNGMYASSAMRYAVYGLGVWISASKGDLIKVRFENINPSYSDPAYLRFVYANGSKNEYVAPVTP